ncbi:DUF7033 domain-containing protein [Flavihumibacter profundi]|uniref:DUF7033 domain-containing protein n=1 Tax=Flavihumibacter profundi TaxID=2716883 RepID=UPI001CC6E0DC|nr:hypothetical protein [Flavihumibacter profundi]MBZ5858644.1 hypothetical protein [Flavihumibacter profundi]
MLIYTQQRSSRLSYVVDFISREILLERADITTDPNVFHLYEGAKINYSPVRYSEQEFFLPPVNLLFEDDIKPQEVVCFNWNTSKAFFSIPEGDLPFDILAAIFYLVSRYEEYLPHGKDAYGRFSYLSSLAYREGFLDEPLVNIWLQQWQEILKVKYPQVLFRRKSFTFMPTYDIDMMYAYLSKGMLRSIGGLLKSVVKFDWPSTVRRFKVLRGKEKDPYDAYEWLDALHLYCRSKPVFFFLVAQEQQGYDRNISTEVKEFQTLINYYAATYKVGLHPSWQSSVAENDKILAEEKEWIEAVADITISKSRQHYIKFSLPETFERLYRCGIRQEFSMGYGSINGFRASVASSYYWFNLRENAATDLMLYPFCFMDANSFYEQKLSPQQAYTELMKYYAAVKKVRGCFITIWHNTILGTDPQYKGWREVYEIFMKEDAYWDSD